MDNAASPSPDLDRSLSSVSNPPAADAIRVVCRFRPPKAVEISEYGQSTDVQIFNIDESRGTVAVDVDFEKKYFTFDKVFGVTASQAEVFQSVVNTVDSIMEGFNGTILAYGQTSSGKTHTMEGPSLRDTDAQGVIPRTIDKLFTAICDADVHTAFTVSVSYYEVYRERIRDLLNPTQDNLKMREVKQEGFVIQDVTEVFCVDKESIIRIVETGKAHRASAPTLMNAESSRSHSILSILVTQKNETTGRNRKGKIYLVDLAGSEKVSKTGAKGTRLEEAKNINRSLTTLCMVISALCYGLPHIPYRDSKLSRILQDSLGGNSKTTLIVCCAPEERHCSETVSTLRFGERAKRIKNNAKVNEELGVPELKRMLHVAQKEIATLRHQLEDVERNKSVSSAIVPKNESLGIDLDDVSEGGGSVQLLDQDEDVGNSDSEDDEEGAAQQVRISELEEALEMERLELQTERTRYRGLQAENEALKSTVEELEEKLLQAHMQVRKHSVDSVSGLSLAGGGSVGGSPGRDTLNMEGEDIGKILLLENSSDQGDTCNTDISGACRNIDDANIDDRVVAGEGGSSAADIEALRQESLQLKGLLVGEIEALESTLSAREEETKSARAAAAEYADKYARLRQEYDNQIQRLILKLSQEQHARIEVEDRLEQTLQKLWSNPPSGEADNRQGGGFFSKLFHAGAAGAELRSLSRVSNFKKERDMSRELEKQQVQISQLTAAMESTKEAQRIVLETKESVMRSLLKQNVTVSQERDSLARRVEDLTSTVEQLTGLLRSVQSRSALNLGDSSGVIGSSRAESIILGGGHTGPRVTSGSSVIIGGGGSRKQTSNSNTDST